MSENDIMFALLTLYIVIAEARWWIRTNRFESLRKEVDALTGKGALTHAK